MSQVGSLKGGASQLSLDFDSGIENMEVGIGRSQCGDSEINSMRIQYFVETRSGPESGLDPYPSPVFFYYKLGGENFKKWFHFAFGVWIPNPVPLT